MAIGVQLPENSVMAWDGQFALEPVHFPSPKATPLIARFQGVVIGTGIDIGLGDEVAAYDANGHICGVGVVGDPSLGLYFPNEFLVNVYGDDPNTPDVVEGPVEGDPLTFRFWDNNRGLEYDTTPLDPATGGEIQAIWSGSTWQPTITNINLRLVSLNHLPEIISYTANPLQIAPGETANLSFQVQDQDNDKLSYSLSASAGGFNPQSGEISPPYPATIQTSWVAPAKEGTYQITLILTDENNATAEKVISLDVAKEDKIPPIDVGRLTARVQGQEVDLSWEASPSTDLAGYYIYQRIGETGKYVKIADLPPTALSYKVSLSYGKTYWFKVTAFDKKGNESAGREIQVKVTKDTEPPEVSVDVKDNQVWVRITDDGLLDEGKCSVQITDEDGNPVKPQPVFDKQLSPDGRSLTIDAVLYPGLYSIHVLAQDQAGHSVDKVFSRALTSGQPLGLDLSVPEVFVPKGKDRVIKIVGGTPPYSIGSPNSLTLRSYIEGDQLTIEGVSQGWQDLQVQDAAGATVRLHVGVVPVLEKGKPLKVISIDRPGTKADPINQPLATNWSEGHFSINLSVPDYGKPVDLYVGLTYTSSEGGNPLLVLFDKDARPVTDLVPFRSGLSDNLTLSLASYPVEILPPGRYRFYYLVLPEGESLKGQISGRLYDFGMAVDEVPKGVSGGPIAGSRPDPLLRPVCISHQGKGLKVSIDLPYYKDGSIDLYLGIESGGQWWIVSPEAQLQSINSGIPPFLTGVSGLIKDITIDNVPEKGSFYYLIVPSDAGPIDKIKDYRWGMMEF